MLAHSVGKSKTLYLTVFSLDYKTIANPGLPFMLLILSFFNFIYLLATKANVDMTTRRR